MGADNWGICPKCKRKAEADQAEAIAKVATSYGKIDSAEFIRQSKEVAQPLNLRQTLREDYELRIDEDGEFMVSYSGSCDVCKFRYQFKHEEQLNLDEL